MIYLNYATTCSVQSGADERLQNEIETSRHLLTVCFVG